jgi:hypothetical protein
MTVYQPSVNVVGILSETAIIWYVCYVYADI